LKYPFRFFVVTLTKQVCRDKGPQPLTRRPPRRSCSWSVVFRTIQAIYVLAKLGLADCLT